MLERGLQFTGRRSRTDQRRLLSPFIPQGFVPETARQSQQKVG
jgi:hypothetical protein